MEILKIKGNFACPVCGYKQTYKQIEEEIYSSGISIDDEDDNFEDSIRCSGCSCSYRVKGEFYFIIENFQPVKLSNKQRLVALRSRLMFYIDRRHDSFFSGLAQSRIKYTIKLMRVIQEEIKNGVSFNV